MVLQGTGLGENSNSRGSKKTHIPKLINNDEKAAVGTEDWLRPTFSVCTAPRGSPAGRGRAPGGGRRTGATARGTPPPAALKPSHALLRVPAWDPTHRRGRTDTRSSRFPRLLLAPIQLLDSSCLPLQRVIRGRWWKTLRVTSSSFTCS